MATLLARSNFSFELDLNVTLNCKAKDSIGNYRFLLKEVNPIYMNLVILIFHANYSVVTPPDPNINYQVPILYSVRSQIQTDHQLLHFYLLGSVSNEKDYPNAEQIPICCAWRFSFMIDRTGNCFQKSLDCFTQLSLTSDDQNCPDRTLSLYKYQPRLGREI